MPGFDGTGPRGQGPMTGGGQGYCVAGLEERGRSGSGQRRGLQGGFAGRGGGWQWDDTSVPSDIPAGDYAGVEGLAKQIQILTSRVEELRARLEVNGGNDR